jgi:hypothetical protein
MRRDPGGHIRQRAANNKMEIAGMRRLPVLDVNCGKFVFSSCVAVPIELYAVSLLDIWNVSF